MFASALVLGALGVVRFSGSRAAADLLSAVEGADRADRPIAVLGVLETAWVPKGLKTKIAGESLFNDGVAVVSPIGLPAWRAMPSTIEAVGETLFGLAVGPITYCMPKDMDSHAAMGRYSAAAAWWNLPGPIAMVVAGLRFGNYGRCLAISAKTRGYLELSTSLRTRSSTPYCSW